jgi:hypothetical protein
MSGVRKEVWRGLLLALLFIAYLLNFQRNHPGVEK